MTSIIEHSKLSSSQITNQKNYSNFENLPNDIIEEIILKSTIQSILSLSLTSKSCYNLIHSDSIWRKICKSLISNWIYNPFKFNQIHQIHQNQNQNEIEIEKVDWTLDFKFGLNQINNWFQLTTTFILPNLQYFGWHASNRTSLGRLILVTFDPKKCEIIGEEIKSINAFDITYYQEYTRIEGLPKSRPEHPIHAIRLSPRMDLYRLPIDTLSPYAGYSIDLFNPIYICLPYFKLNPSFLTSSSSFINSPLKLLSSLDSLESLQSNFKNFLSNEIIQSLRLIQSRLNLSISQLNLHPLISTNFSKNHLISNFKLFILSNSNHKTSINISNHSSIRYQSLPRIHSNLSTTIMHNGRRYITRNNESSSEISKEEEEEERFFPILESNEFLNGLMNGIWVGYYGFHHGVEFGKILIKSIKNQFNNNLIEISFIKLTGDRNVPNGMISWKTTLNLNQKRNGKIKGIVNFDWINRLDSGLIDQSEWSNGRVKGQGRVANVNYENPIWINTSISFIEENENEENENEENEWNGSNVKSIRVVWHELNHVSSFYKV